MSYNFDEEESFDEGDFDFMDEKSDGLDDDSIDEDFGLESEDEDSDDPEDEYH